ncbi:MAG: DMT family transporter [Candidatus Thorarchaeota archaeon]
MNHIKSQRAQTSRDYIKAVLLAIFVTILWSSSWVIIKFGLEEIPPLTFAGLRYFIAALILMTAIGASKTKRSELRVLRRRQIYTLVGYGIVFVAITQGSQFVGLNLLEAITVSLLLNMTPLLVLVFGISLLKEVPTPTQIVLILIGIFGVLVYFYPLDLGMIQILGLVVVLVGVVSNAFSSIIGRAINRKRELSPLIVTGTSMMIGALFLLVAGIAVENLQAISILSWVYIIWLAVVNTALAFTLWNRAMQTIRAIDISIINGTMLPQIVILSIIFLGEMPSVLNWLGLALIAFSALLVQVIQAKRQNSSHSERE